MGDMVILQISYDLKNTVFILSLYHLNLKFIMGDMKILKGIVWP